MATQSKTIRKAKIVIKKAAKAASSVQDPSKAAATADLPWMKYVAMLTGVLAAVAGFLTVRGATLTNQAIYESNQAILSQTQASDAWAEYQAGSIKARIVETQLLAVSPLSAGNRDELSKADAELRGLQPVLKQAAAEKERLRDQHLREGSKRLGEKDELEYAGMAVQLGIALASVAAMTRKRAVFIIGAGVGICGVLITAYAMMASWLRG